MPKGYKLIISEQNNGPYIYIYIFNYLKFVSVLLQTAEDTRSRNVILQHPTVCHVSL